MKLIFKMWDKLHRIVYIEYNDNLPHTVITFEENKYVKWWDFFPNNGDRLDLRAYNSGSGGSIKQIQAPTWADGYTGKYWLAEDAKFRNKPKNARRLKHPVKIKGYFGNKSINPFKIAEITNSYEYCDMCGHSSIEICDEHIYMDEKGNLRYKHDDTYAE